MTRPTCERDSGCLGWAGRCRVAPPRVQLRKGKGRYRVNTQRSVTPARSSRSPVLPAATSQEQPYPWGRAPAVVCGCSAGTRQPLLNGLPARALALPDHALSGARVWCCRRTCCTSSWCRRPCPPQCDSGARLSERQLPGCPAEPASAFALEAGLARHVGQHAAAGATCATPSVPATATACQLLSSCCLSRQAACGSTVDAAAAGRQLRRRCRLLGPADSQVPRPARPPDATQHRIAEIVLTGCERGITPLIFGGDGLNAAVRPRGLEAGSHGVLW
jgi:hypothetical protein